MKLGKLETLLPEANAIDLGCGADGGALPFLLKEEGVRPIGVERNPSRENRTLLTTEVELREHQLGFPGSEAAQFSCYPFYPNKHRQAGAQVSDAIDFLAKRLKIKKPKGIVLPAVDMPLELPTVDEEVMRKVIKGDVFKVLSEAQDGQFEYIWLSYLINNMQERANDLLQLCRKKLRDDGTVWITQDTNYTQDLCDQASATGFKLESVSAVEATDSDISLDRKGRVLMNKDKGISNPSTRSIFVKGKINSVLKGR